jgi:hypothetical protein
MRYQYRGGPFEDETAMADVDNHDSTQTLILNAIKQKDPSIQPGETFD